MVAAIESTLADVRLGPWNATVLGGAVFLAMIGVAAAVLPGVNEVPQDFPAATLWQFRVASLGIQAILWTVIGLLFGALTERGRIARADRRPAGDAA